MEPFKHIDNEKEVLELKFHLLQNREHLFTQEWLLKNARTVKGLA